MLPILAIGLTAIVAHGQSQFQYIPLSQQMGVTQQLGSSIPADVPFLDEQGRKVTIGTYLGKEPVLLLPIFYQCKTGCAMITDGLKQTLLKASQPTGFMALTGKDHFKDPLTPGKDLEIVMVSIDPTETPALAANKKNQIVSSMDMTGNSGFAKMLKGSSGSLAESMDAHLHLLTGSLANIHKVTDAIGFKYYYNSFTGQINHPTCSVILTPKGVISSYTIGNDFPTRMLESSLALAANNEVSSRKADQSFMFGCIMLDPQTGKTRIVFERVIDLVCVVFLLGFGFGIYRMIRNERKMTIVNGGNVSGLAR